MTQPKTESIGVQLESIRGTLATNHTAMQMGFNAVRQELGALKESVDKFQEDHEGRVRTLEGTRHRLLGASGVLGMIAGVLGGWIAKLIGGGQ